MSTAEFVKYACWKPEYVADVIRRDAASLGPDVLLAVHQGETSDNTFSQRGFSDEDVLNELMNEAEQLCIIAIIGDSGAGKSHLVQWLRARLFDAPNSLMIYVPRNLTGLRGLLECVIDGLRDAGINDEADLLRQQMQQAVGHVSIDEIPGKLLDAMAQYLEHYQSPGSATKDEKKRVGVAQQLPNLLRDPVSRSWFLSDQGAARRFAAQQAKQFDPDADSEVRFGSADIPSEKDVKVIDLGEPARRTLQEISTPTRAEASFRDVAESLLNEALVAAIPEVFGLRGAHTLGSVFETARRLLLERDQQMVVLVEDLTQFNGVERELLNAFINPVEENGVRVRCTLRVALAVTTGYYLTLPDTLRTRVNREFNLTTEADQSDSMSRRIAAFTAKYLRATRVSPEERQRAFDAATDEQRRGGGWMPNPCDACDFRRECHQAFGEVDGVGLYPFNRAALSTMAHSAFRELPGTDGRFNPRQLLMRVLLRCLDAESTSELEEGQFPSNRLDQKFTEARNLPANLRLVLDGDPSGPRTLTLAKYWGDCASPFENEAAVRRAFAMGPARESVGVKPPPPPDDVGGDDVDGGGINVKVDPVAEWAGGQPLIAVAAERIRSALFDAVCDRIGWGVVGVRPRQDYMVGPERAHLSNVLQRFSFTFDNQAGEATEAATVVTRHFTPSTDGNLVIRFDQVLSARAARADSMALSVGLDHYCDVQRLVDEVADVVTDSVAEIVWSSAVNRPVRALVGRLAAGGLVAGVCRASDDVDMSGELLNEPLLAGQLGRTTEWQDLRGALVEKRSNLVESLVELCSYRQGDRGKVLVVRTGRLLAHLRDFLGNWELGASSDLRPNRAVSAFARDLRSVSKRQVEGAVRREQEVIHEILQSQAMQLGASTIDLKSLAETLGDAFNTALLCGVGFGLIQNVNDDVRRLTETALAEPPSPPGDDASLLGQLQWCASVINSGWLQVNDVVERLSGAIELGISTAELELANLGTAGDGPGVLLTAVRDALRCMGVEQ